MWLQLGAVGEASSAVEQFRRAITAWQTIDESEHDNEIALADRHLKLVGPMLATMAEALVAWGRHRDAWEFAATRYRCPVRAYEPISAVPSAFDHHAVIRAARFLTSASDYLNALGIAVFHQGLLDAAEELYSESLAYSHSDDIAQRGRILSNLAQVAQARGNLVEAARGFREALELLNSSGDVDNAQITELHIAELQLEQGDVAGAEAIARALLKRAGPSNPRWWDADRLLIVALGKRQSWAEVAIRAERRHGYALAARLADIAWESLIVLVTSQFHLADPAGLAAMVRAVEETLASLPGAPSASYERLAQTMLRNEEQLCMDLDPADAARLERVLAELHPDDQSHADRAELLARAFAARPVGEGTWRRIAHVIVSPRDEWTRSMISDLPPETVVTPAYVRYPLAPAGNVRVSDAHVDGAVCWVRTSRALAYRYDGMQQRSCSRRSARTDDARGVCPLSRRVGGS